MCSSLILQLAVVPNVPKILKVRMNFVEKMTSFDCFDVQFNVSVDEKI